MPSPSSPYVVCRYSETFGASEAWGISDESSDLVDGLTYFAEHEDEDKSAGRLMPRSKECVYRDPIQKGHVGKKHKK